MAVRARAAAVPGGGKRIRPTPILLWRCSTSSALAAAPRLASSVATPTPGAPPAHAVLARPHHVAGFEAFGGLQPAQRMIAGRRQAYVAREAFVCEPGAGDFELVIAREGDEVLPGAAALFFHCPGRRGTSHGLRNAGGETRAQKIYRINLFPRGAHEGASSNLELEESRVAEARGGIDGEGSARERRPRQDRRLARRRAGRGRFMGYGETASSS